MSQFDPQDPDYIQRVQESFAKQNAMINLGIEITHIAPGEVNLRLPFNTDFTQQHGFMHAGITTTALDSACGYAAFSLMPAEAAVLTVEFKTSLLAPAQGDYFSMRAKVTKPGRTLFFTEAEAYAIYQDQEKKIATMSATMMAVSGRPTIQN